ncbi:MAG: hypothetical protein M1820_009883 [Bogoriella megaspora]|nr:MAG: hypothetical protein M1820_009883 [Bogoriella megaspora]
MSQDEQRLRSVPWCRQILDDPNFTHFPFGSRKPKPFYEDALFSQTLKTADTVSAAVCMYRKSAGSGAHRNEVRALITLGNLLDGIPHVCHGGMVATILDEVMGMLFEINQSLGAQRESPSGDFTVTAYLNTSYLKPVATPQTVLVTSRLKEIKGRKRFVDADIKDADGNVLAKGDALFIASASNSEAKL